MGFWSGIKYALNSTLGTNEFKPLNEYIKDLIIGQKRLTASDAVLAVILNKEIIPNVSETTRITLGTFTPTVSGNIRVFVSAYHDHSSSSSASYVQILSSEDIVIGEIAIPKAFSDEPNKNYKDYTLDINVKKDDEYLIRYYKNRGATGIKSVQIKGSVVDATTYNYISYEEV